MNGDNIKLETKGLFQEGDAGALKVAKYINVSLVYIQFIQLEVHSSSSLIFDSCKCNLLDLVVTVLDGLSLIGYTGDKFAGGERGQHRDSILFSTLNPRSPTDAEELEIWSLVFSTSIKHTNL